MVAKGVQQSEIPKTRDIKKEEAEVLKKEERAELNQLRVAIDANEKAAIGVRNPWDVTKIKISAKNDKLVPVLVLSDWHVGETVFRDDVPNGCNEYSISIAKERAQKIVSRAVWLMQNSGDLISQDTMVCALLGDFMTGIIHEELERNAVFSELEEQELVSEILSGVIKFLLENTSYKKIIIPTCHGNHGRNTHKMHIKGSARTSYEHFVYRQLAKEYKDEKRLEFVIGKSYHTLINIGDVRVRFHHGDGIKSMGGIGGVAIPLNKAVARYNVAYRADLDIIGHFHQMLDGGNWVINGSLIGYSAYAAKIGCPFELPRQALVLVHPKRGKAGVMPVWAD